MKVEIEISINNINNRKSIILNLNKIILIKLFIILFIYITFINFKLIIF
jgi:hypothetical protein